MRAVLCDRDGTLVVDVPYNGDPQRVELLPGVRSGLELLREQGLATAVISNQSGVGHGLISIEDVHAVNGELARLAGPFDIVLFCPHRDDDGCSCRKPRAGMVADAARRLGVEPAECVVIGDHDVDRGAAQAAGAAWILVGDDLTFDAAARIAVGWS